MQMTALVNVYACSPRTGSETGTGWQWCKHLANYCNLHIITEGEFRTQIEGALEDLPQRGNMHFYYLPVSDRIRRMCWNQGDWRFYPHYRRWQHRAYELALHIVSREKIDILHQLNMIGFREPGYLWKITDIPFVWGPVDAKESFPTAYLKDAGWQVKAATHLKNMITKWQLRYGRRVGEAVRRADLIVSASSNSQYSFSKYFGIDSPLLNETGCDRREVQGLPRDYSEEILEVLWVGKLDFRKQLGLAIRSLAHTANSKIRLHIVGGGDSQAYRQLAAELGVSQQVVWYGVLSHEEVQRLMQRLHLLFFTSVSEGTPHVVLEAMANGLPVLCFDTCGQGDVVNENIGYKIPLSTVPQSTAAFAAKLNALFRDRDSLANMTASIAARQQELSWDSKAQQMVQWYNEILESYRDKS